MKRIKKLLISLVAACLLFSTTGCIVQVNEEKNRNIVVALIDGKYEIKKGDYIDMFNYYVALYAAYGMDIFSDSKTLASVRENCINALIEDKICEIEMDKVDFAINDEDREKAKEDFEEMIQKLADQYKKDAEKEAEKNTEDADDDEDADNTEEDNTDDADKEEEKERDFVQEARDYYADLIEKKGMTEEEYIDELANPHRLDRFKKYIMSETIVPTDEDILKYYNEQLDAQKLKPDLNADVVLYEPGGVSYKVIKVALTTEEQKEYKKLIDEDKDDDAEAYLKKTSYLRAKEYLSRINNGESFEDVLKDANAFLVEKCGEAEDSIKAPSEVLKLYKTVGSTGFAGTLDTKLLAAAEGDVTGVLEASDGVYVIGKCYGRFQSVIHEYEVGNDIYNDIKEAIQEDRVESGWDDKLKALVEAHDVKIYTNRINKNY